MKREFVTDRSVSKREDLVRKKMYRNLSIDEKIMWKWIKQGRPMYALKCENPNRSTERKWFFSGVKTFKDKTGKLINTITSTHKDRVSIQRRIVRNPKVI